jgi:hypothetical protein
MKTKLKSLSIYIITTLLILGGVALAGTLAPTGGNTSTPTMYTLTDIYQKTQDFTYTEQSHDVSTDNEPAEPGTMHTLSDIWTGLTNFILPPTSKVEDGYFYGPNGSLEGKLSAGTPSLTWSSNDYMESDTPAYTDWNTATTFCNDSTEGEVSQGTWRLPTYPELVAKYLATNPGNASGFQTGYYWSSTEYPFNSDNAYYVYMNYGYASLSGKSNPSYYARCVH